MFRRRSADIPPATPTSPTGTASGPPDEPPGSSKGRPTPSRKQAESERLKRARPTLDRRAEARRRREAQRAQRAKVQQAMVSGDERHFVARDRGPVRRFVRDYVDSRRSVAEYFLPLLLVIFGLSLVPSAPIRSFVSLLWSVSMIAVVADTGWLSIRLRREIARRFPDDHGRGHLFYGLTRVTQLRRFRLPKPRVKPGAAV